MRNILDYRHHKAVRQLSNAGLRMASLGTKLILTLYMGRYLGLTEMGTYGLVAAYVAIAIPLLGMRIDYVVTREIVDADPLFLAVKMRDEGLFYFMNYLLFVALALVAMVLRPDIFSSTVVTFALILSISESIGAVSSGNFVPLGKPITSTFLFFVRSALWTVPVMGLGFFYPEFRTANTVFAFWLGGVLISLLANGYIWRNLPWRAAFKVPVDWCWIKRSIVICLPIWLGAVGSAASANLDRFVVEYYLGRDFVGIASFYGSFLGAMIALLQNGVIVFSYPKLVSYFRQGERDKFRAEARWMTWQSTISSALLALVIGIVIPVLGMHLGRPEFSENAPTLWLMLVGVWIKGSAESLYYVLYARHQDWPIWSGNLILLGVSLLSSLICVPMFGFIGIGYSAIVSAVFICLWRIYWVMQYNVPEMEKVS